MRAGRANANSSGSTSRQAELSAVLSASLRADLLREVEGLNSVDDAAVWAQRRLAAKNALSAADAEHVEQAFESKLATVMHELGDEACSPYEHDKRLSRRKRNRQRSQVAINRTLLALPAPRRVRDREHVKSVAKEPCLICGRSPSDAYHLRFAQSRALGRKVKYCAAAWSFYAIRSSGSFRTSAIFFKAVVVPFRRPRSRSEM
jgi:hypothetical protein